MKHHQIDQGDARHANKTEHLNRRNRREGQASHARTCGEHVKQGSLMYIFNRADHPPRATQLCLARPLQRGIEMQQGGDGIG